jgi:cephalosporin hydroxylase
MNENDKFRMEVSQNIVKIGNAKEAQAYSQMWLRQISPLRYSHNFEWLSRPIIQLPQDTVQLQEIVWATKPDLIIETGIAHGGSLVLSASMLALLDMADAMESGDLMDPKISKRKVLGIDIDIRRHNQESIENHSMSSRIEMIQGSSIEANVIKQVEAIARNYQRIMVCLDSNHTHDHVLAELNAYAPLTSVGNYCVVMDTLIDDMPKESFPDRPWGPGNNPKTAVREFMKSHSEFKIDKRIDQKLLISVAPDGYLQRIA